MAGLVMVALGVGVTLMGERFRGHYFREFSDPLYASNASLMRRAVAVFLTAGAMLVIFGACFAFDDAWRLLRGGS